MALFGMADNNVEIPAKRDGAIYNTFAGNTDYVIAGVGDEFEITSSSTSFVIALGTGEGIVCGRHVTEVAENGVTSSIQLNANETGYVVIRMDLTRPTGTEAYLTTTPLVQRDNLNGSGTVADLPLYQYTTDGNGVSSFIDVRNVRSAAGSAKTEFEVNMLAASWSSSNTYAITNPAISPDKEITITYKPNISDAKFIALRTASVRVSGNVGEGTLTLKAVNGKPTVDIPIIIIVKG